MIFVLSFPFPPTFNPSTPRSPLGRGSAWVVAHSYGTNYAVWLAPFVQPKIHHKTLMNFVSQVSRKQHSLCSVFSHLSIYLKILLVIISIQCHFILI